MTIRGTERSFIVCVPSSYDGKNPLPLVFMFHGLGSTAARVSGANFGWQDSAETNNFFVVFPESRDDLGLFLGQTKYWDINPGSPDSQDLDFVKGIINWMESNYKIRGTHIFCTGHSYGAFFSYYAAVHLNDLISVFGSHSGGIDNSLQSWPNPIPADGTILKGILLHCPDDSVVPYSNSQNLYNGLISGGHISELITLDAGLDYFWDKTKNQTQIDFFMTHAPAAEANGHVKSMPWLPLLLND